MDGRNHADEAFSVTSAPTQWITRSSTAWSAPCTGLRWMRGAHSPRLLGRIREVGPWLGLCQRGVGGGHGYWRSCSQTSQGGHVVHGRHLLGPDRHNYDAHTHTHRSSSSAAGAVTNFPLLLSRASPLRIPRSTAAYGLGKSEAGIPPSPGGASLSTPRESMETSVPGTPSSPRTPGGRRRWAGVVAKGGGGTMGPPQMLPRLCTGGGSCSLKGWE